MAPKRLIRRHQPLITPRIAFEIRPLSAPPPLTLRKNLADRIRRTLDQGPNHRIGSPPEILLIPTSDKGVRLGPSESKKIVATDDNEDPITDDESDSTDQDDVEEGTSQHVDRRSSRIPKPPGEAGRPGSGGFSLPEALGWSKDYFASVQVFLSQN